MKYKILTIATMLALSTPALADSVKGDVQDHYKTVLDQKPYRVEVCKDVQVQNGSSGTDTGGAIIGGLIGGVIGNQFGKGGGKEAMTGIGAITGAIIGGESKAEPSSRIERQCFTETRYEESTRSVYSHSTITFYENGKQYSLRFQK